MRSSIVLGLAVASGLLFASAAGAAAGPGAGSGPSVGALLTRAQYYDDHYHHHCYRRCARYDYYGTAFITRGIAAGTEA